MANYPIPWAWWERRLQVSHCSSKCIMRNINIRITWMLIYKCIYLDPTHKSQQLWSAFLTNALADSKALVWVSKITQWLSVWGLLQKQFISTNWVLRTCQRLCWILETQRLTKFLLSRSSEQNSLILMMSNISNCCFMTHAFGIVSRNSLLNLS